MKREANHKQGPAGALHGLLQRLVGPAPVAKSEQPAQQAATERFRRATGVMQETAKWLLTVFAGLGSLLLAGLRFSDVGKLDLASPPFWLALLGAALALAGVGWILWSASRVLSAHYVSFQEVLAVGEAVEARGIPAEWAEGLFHRLDRERHFLYRGVAADRRSLFRQVGELRAGFSTGLGLCEDLGS